MTTGTPSVIFDAVALVLSEEGCTEVLQEGAVTDFGKDVFGPVKAIGFTAEARLLLVKAGVVADAGVIDLRAATEGFLEPARTRQWNREPKVRLSA